MPTVNNMLSGTYSLYKSSYANGTLFSNYNASNSNGGDSISKLWSSYNSYQSNANEALSGLSMISSNVSSLVASYDSTKKTFYNEFDDTINDLQKSSDNIKSYDFNVGASALTAKESVDEDGNKVTSYEQSDKLKDAIKAVKDFVSDYNDTLKFFNDNGDVSKRIRRMNTMFADNTYRRANYQQIGISVGSDGKMTVDEEKLAKVLSEDAESYAKEVENGNTDKVFHSRVADILGKDGLAGKTDDHISVAKGQRDRLFPSAQTLIGKDLSTAAIYTGTSYRNMTNYSSIGNLINMMF